MHILDAAALAWFRDLESRAGGYALRGVRGWASRADCDAGLAAPVPERLPRLARRSLLERHDARPPGLARPVWLYRITAAGARVVAEWHGVDGAVPEPPRASADPAFHLAQRPRAALVALRRAMAEGAGHDLLPGEPGWRTSRQLLGWDELGSGGYEPRSRGGWSEPEERDDAPWGAAGWDGGGNAGPDEPYGEGWDGLYGDMPADPQEPAGWWIEDLAWLVAAGLAQRWRAAAPGRVRPVTLYRVTRWGMEAPVLEWHAPEPHRPGGG